MSVSLEGLSPEAISELAVLAKTLSDSPKTRGHFLSLMKEADPSVNIPEIDIPNRIGAAFQPHLERLEKLEREKLENDARSAVMDRRNAVIKKGLASESDIPEIEKLMLERGITSHETAAEFYTAQQKAARPTPGAFGQHIMPKPDMKDMNGNINLWARSEAGKAMEEIIKLRRA